MISKIAPAFALYVGLAEAATTPGSCPNVPVVEDFDKSRYLGRWYEIMKDQANPGEWFGKCVTATYTPSER